MYGRRTPRARPAPGGPLASLRLPHFVHLMVDYQFLAMVALGLAVVTRGAVLPVLAMTAVVALVMLAYEAGCRRLRRRLEGPIADDAPAPSDTELTRWMRVMDRILRSND
jgi:hypothetical protein